MVKQEMLALLPLLAELSETERNQIAELLMKKQVTRGEAIILAKDSSRTLYFIVDGKVKVSVADSSGKEIILAVLERGEVFGEIALLTGEDRSADVSALEDCLLLQLSHADFAMNQSKLTGFMNALLVLLAHRLRTASLKIADLALLDVSQRLFKTLCALAERRVVSPNVAVFEIANRPTHQELASMIGTSREIITRALKALERDGYLRMTGKSIALEDIRVVSR